MKTPKSPENEEVTPSKKKLKQARLPFKIISDGSPKAETPPSRKRKLSAPEAEPVTKLGKVAKENNQTDEAVVISDDDSRDSSKVTKDPKEDKQVNPFVKLVDKARKKKLQKSKTSKKKRSGSKKSLSAGNSTDATENADSDSKVSETVESMDVDLEEDEDKLNKEGQEKEKSEENNDVVTDEAVVILDSNHASVQDDRNTQNSTQEDAEKLDNVDENCHNKDDNISGDNKSANEVVILEDSNQATEQDVKSTQGTVHDQIQADHDDSAKVALGATSDNENSEDEKIVSDSEESEDKGDTSISVEKENKNSDRDTSISITPKRSARNKQKEQSKLNSSQLSTGEESVSNPSTPRRSTRSSSVSKNQGDVSLNESSSANLTPKQLQKKLELAKKKEEREKEKQERDKKKQQEKDERAKQRLEKEEQRKREKEEKEEAKRKEREEKEEQKKKEREEREKQKEVEKKLKEEKEEQKRKEKEEKEEQRRKEKEAREEEKRKKLEALEQEKLEQEQKKKKAAEAFVNFFVPKQKVEKDQTTEEPVSKSSLLSSFTIKSDMRLAPTVRNNLTEEKRQYLDDLLTEQNIPKSSLYIHSLKEGVNKPLSFGKTWPMDDKDDDIMIVEDELPPMDGADEILTCDAVVREKLRPKLLSFHENRRPPYWGTWRKKSTHVKPRRPFTQDQKHLDYEVDSDEEWEEEQEGESIDGSAAGSDDDQDADEYEVDNELFVPHGYLSDEEATMDEDDVLSLSPETQKARLKHLEDEFESELKKPTEKLKPRMYGLLWETSDGSKPEKCVDALWNYFKKLAMIMNDPTPLLQPSSEPEEPEKKKVKKKKSLPDSDNQSPKTDKKKKRDNKEAKTSKTEPKKNAPEIKKNQPGINSFLTISKVKS